MATGQGDHRDRESGSRYGHAPFQCHAVLDAFGHIVIAWLWLRQALIAQEALQKGAQEDIDFYEGKVAACQFFFRYHLPQAAEKLRYVACQDRSVLETQASWFTGQ